MVIAMIFILGIVVGSFLNVCIYRIPRRESIVRPRSACPLCGNKIAFYDNMPILSYLFLGGKCRHCGSPISWQYPVVEALNGILWVLVYVSFGLNLSGVLYAAFCSAMIALAFIDVHFRILPHGITFGGLILGFLSAPWQALHQTDLQLAAIKKILGTLGIPWEAPMALAWVDSFLGILCGAGMLLLTAVGYYLVRKEEGMGHGDIVMMAFVGAVLGPMLAFLTILMGSFIGAVSGLMLIQITKDSKYQIPFGTFLGGAAVVSLLVGNDILQWYWNLT